MSMVRETPEPLTGHDVIDQILTAVADETDTNVLSLPPLGRTVDTDALVKLVERPSVDHTAFEYAGQVIEVDCSDPVSVTLDAVTE